MRVEPGTVIGGDFLIERFLKAGGMGDIYVARQLSTEKQRALKLMKSELTRDPRSQERFKQEAKVAAKIDSANIVEMVSAGIDEQTGRPWLAMELLNGDDLRTYVEKYSPLSAGNMLRLYEQLCRALGKAHEAGVIHRDLKPENIFLVDSREPGQPFTVKVLDFGIAKIVADYNSQSAGTVQIGTPLWMAPEQTDSSAQITVAADIWPLGLMAFWLLTGRYYWRSAEKQPISILAIMRELVSGPYDSASKRAADLGCADKIPPGFDEWFQQCIDRNPEKRFASAPEAAAQLSLVLQAYRISQRNPPQIAPIQTDSWRGDISPRRLQRRWPAVTSLALAGGLGTAALVGIVLGISKATLERARAVCSSGKVDVLERSQACLRACDKGSLPHCIVGGDLVLTLRGSMSSAAKDAQRAYKVACEGKQPGGCSRLAKLFYDGTATRRDPQQALDLYLSSCENGEYNECVTAGRMLLSGDGGTRSDPSQARELFKQASEKGVAAAFNELGMALRKEDPQKAFMFLQQGCDKGDASSCIHVGDELRAGNDFVHKNERGAMIVYQQACDRGSAEGCTNLADLERAGVSGSKDEKAAAKHYQFACGQQQQQACINLAHYELDGSSGIDKNLMHAVETLAGACNKQHILAACLDLGTAYRDGRGVDKDPAKAKPYLEAACSGGIKDACVQPPLPHQQPVPCPDLEKMYDRCEAGSGEICNQLGGLHERGRCASKNICEGHRLYKIGCHSFKDSKACENHTRFHSEHGNLCGG